MAKIAEDPYYMLKPIWRRLLELDNEFLSFWRPFKDKQKKQLSVLQHIIWNIYDWSVPFTSRDGSKISLLEIARSSSPTYGKGMACFIGPLHLPQSTGKGSFNAHLNFLLRQRPCLIERVPRGDEQEVFHKVTEDGKQFVMSISPRYFELLEGITFHLRDAEAGELSRLLFAARPAYEPTKFERAYSALGEEIARNHGVGRRRSLLGCGEDLADVVKDVQRRFYMGRALDGPAELLALSVLLTGACEITEFEEVGTERRARMRTLLEKLRLGLLHTGKSLKEWSNGRDKYSLP